MIRRDYILRMIEEFMQALSRLRSLKQGQRWNEAADELDSEFQKLIGEGAESIARRSETELLARLMQDGPTHALRDKTFILATLLAEAGDVADSKDQSATSRECHLKALHLLLDVLGRDDVFECPGFVPKVELLRERLCNEPLPLRTLAMLMQHYERTGEFAKAEDELFAMLDAEPDNDTLKGFGITFYQRLLAQSDASLNAADLRRSEVQEGLKELQARHGRHATAGTDEHAT
jgi:hypothetical protein